MIMSAQSEWLYLWSSKHSMTVEIGTGTSKSVRVQSELKYHQGLDGLARNDAAATTRKIEFRLEARARAIMQVTR